jgi:hypothetical protein
MSSALSVGDMVHLNLKVPTVWWSGKMAFVVAVTESTRTTTLEKNNSPIELAVIVDGRPVTLHTCAVYLKDCPVSKKE